MNILFLSVLTVLLVAVLWYLIPWISKTIEEPFQCQVPSTTVPVTFDTVAAPTLADSVELGKQRYNRLNLLQYGQNGRVFQDPAGSMGSLSTTIIEGAPPPSNTGLKVLNENIRKAFETVDILPKTIRHTVSPILGESPYTTITNEVAYLADALTNGATTKTHVGTVEERLPPMDTKKQDAATCEVINKKYTRKAVIAEPQKLETYAMIRGLNATRADMCRDLSGNTLITNAFPGDSSKICGLCIKGAKPISDKSVYYPNGSDYNGIGGMFLSRNDKNIADSRGLAYKPTYGVCEEGYFFVPNKVKAGQMEACMKAAERLNCEELAAQGGFEKEYAIRSLDGTDMSGSNCRACVVGGKPQYVYYKQTAVQTPQRIRVRITTPTGTGRTILKLYTQTPGGNPTFEGKFTMRSTTLTNVSITELRPDNEFVTNIAYCVINANPGDSLLIEAFQEFPHRPRGEKEVFLFETPNITTESTENAIAIANGLNCTIATVEQLNEAQRQGMSVCQPGLAQSGTSYSTYVVRSGSVSEQNPISSDVCPTTLATLGGVQRVTVTPKGIWLYGIKPHPNHLETSNASVMPKPILYNFYENLTNSPDIRQDQRVSKYSVKNSENYPNYRGICIQLEQNEEPVTTYKQINLPIENHIVEVGKLSTDKKDISGALLSTKLQNYSPNGRFNDSERIATPKPVADSPFLTMNQTQYWLWSPHSAESQSNSFFCKVEIPGFFYEPTYIEEDRVRCNGVMHDSQLHLTRTMGSPCDNGLGDETTEVAGLCLDSAFKSVGGKDAGLLSPRNNVENRKLLLYKDYVPNSTRKFKNKRTVQEIKEFLTERYVSVMMGTSPQLNSKSLSQQEKRALMNEASQKLIGEDVVKPCYKAVDTINSDGTVSITVQEVTDISGADEQCLDYLYKYTVPTSGTQATYANMLGLKAYSGLLPEEKTTAPLEWKAHPYQACQPQGSWSPLGNPTAVAEIQAAMKEQTTITSIIGKAQAVFNSVYQDANRTFTNPTPADLLKQETALKRCYGINKKIYVTNCDGVPTKFLSVYKLGATPEALDISNSWTFVLTTSSSPSVTSTVNIPKLASEASNTYTKSFTTLQEYPYATYLTTDYVQYSNILLGSAASTFDKLKINTATVKDASGNLHTIPAANIFKKEGSGAEVPFYMFATIGTNTYIFKIAFKKENNLVKVKLEGVKSTTATVSETDIASFYSSGTIQTIATSAGGDGYGVKSMSVTLEDAPKPYYTLNQQVGIQDITIAGNKEGNDLLVVLRDGPDFASGVAAQKLYKNSATVLKFLQEDLRPYIPYEESKVKPGNTYRFESALGKRYFLQKDGTSVRISEFLTSNDNTTLDNNTKFLLKERKSQATTTITSPIATITSFADATALLTANLHGNYAVTSAPFSGTNANVDWSIVPALNGAYAFVSIMLVNTPGYYIVAKKNTSGTYDVVVELVDPKDDVKAFHACWRLYPAL